MAKRFGKVLSYEEWVQPAIVSNALELLDKEIPKFINKITSVHLCFTSDPFMYQYTDIRNLSIKIIKKFNKNNISCSVLTKGLLPSILADLSNENIYGITLVSLDEDFRKKVEPNSAPYRERINALKFLHEKKIKTWVSIEPYPTPNIIEQDFSKILNTVGFVDKIIFGRLNYNSDVTKYKQHDEYYRRLTEQVINFCNEKKISYHIKSGTIR
jgi:DNA repair photolyase